MNRIFGKLALALALASLGATANVSAMSSVGHCTVVAADNLPPSAGGAELLCAEVESAVASAAPGAVYKAEITVVSRSRLVAALVVNGRPLAEQRLAVMDRELNRRAIERFARALAAEVAKAGKP